MDNARANATEKPFIIAVPEVTLAKGGGAIRRIPEPAAARP
jgi:hypothetical protein